MNTLRSPKTKIENYLRYVPGWVENVASLDSSNFKPFAVEAKATELERFLVFIIFVLYESFWKPQKLVFPSTGSSEIIFFLFLAH